MTLKQNFRDLEADRRAVPAAFAYTGSDGEAPDYHRSFYTSMLLEDIGHQVIPYGLGDDTINVSIRSNTSEMKEYITRALATQQASFDLNGTFREFSKYAAQHMMREGVVRYEIIYWHADGADTPSAFTLEWIPRPSIVRSSGTLYQRVKPSAVDRHGFESKRKLDTNRFAVFRMPPPYASARKRTMEGLHALGEATVMPPFARSAMEEGRFNEVFFDHDEYREKHVYAVAELTRPIGWSARGTFGEWQTGYHVAYRRLRFARFLAHLRSEILTTLNQTLERVGNELGFKTEIRLEGPLSVSDIERLLTELKQEQRSPSEIVDVLSYRH